ncbi:hypothetical protein [Sphingomonas bacterium]|uniref:hypothetical protein n=1 Tax=Sphingomonas bacterium TaxID=1895847 RepID=UPI0015758432|nr:hypothetical protein [Sphingomonas bacterium]
MATRVEISIAGRGEADAPLLTDMLGQIEDFVAMMGGVAASVAGDDVQRYDWRVVGLSKNSPARMTLEAIPLAGHPEGPTVAAQARDLVTEGLDQLRSGGTRPLYFTDNVIEAADRFARRVTGGLTETVISDATGAALTLGTADAVRVIENLTVVRESDPIHPYRELGSFEGNIQNVGTDGYQRPYIVVKSRLTGAEVRCILEGEALKELEGQPVANVVWRHRSVTVIGILRYRSPGRLSQADVHRLDFIDPAEKLPQLTDIIDRNFTNGLSSEDYLERLRSGEA